MAQSARKALTLENRRLTCCAGFVMRSVAILALIAFVGCNAKRNEATNDSTKQEDQFAKAYFAGEANQARHSLLELIQSLEKAKVSLLDQADPLAFAYARWYVLEKRVGNEDAAVAALTKARYWFRRQQELSGKPPAEAELAAKDFGFMEYGVR